MKTILQWFLIGAVLAPAVLHGQQIDNFLDGYHFHKVVNDRPAGDTLEYRGITGNPYLDKSFSDALVFLRDSVVVKMPVRYNIYADVMEYRIDGVEYIIGDPSILLKVQLRGGTFEYVKLGKKSGYAEVLESGTCCLFLKRSVQYHPPEGPKAIECTDKPACFTTDSDRYFLSLAGREPVEVGSLKALLNHLPDHRQEIDAFVEKEKIKGMKRESLVKLIRYYNSL
jgi:hypothetical protein